ncbi:MAG: SCO family protein [Anaerolineae bacterium]|nr:SCO family protein [Anaerolineae bacterium]
MKSVRFGLAVFVCCLALTACSREYTLRGSAITSPKAAPAFTLTDHNGQPFRLSAQQGRVVLVYFGFTSCPDACPTTLSNLARVRRDLGSDAARVQVVMVSLDPERDSAEVLRNYVTAFDATFLGLRGTPEELAPVLKAYGVAAIKRKLPDSALGYTIDHTIYTYVIDPAGRLRETFSPDAATADVASDVRYLIRTGDS